MQTRCKLGGLEDKDPKTYKIMQIRCTPGGLEDQDPKRKKSKTNCASWIRGFCRHLSHPFLKHQNPENEPGFSPKMVLKERITNWLWTYIQNHGNLFKNTQRWRIRTPKLNLDLVPKSCSSLEDQDPKRKMSKINFASWIRGFCRHLSHPCFLREQNPKTEPGFRSKFAVNQVVWRIWTLKLNLDLVPKSCKNN